MHKLPPVIIIPLRKTAVREDEQNKQVEIVYKVGSIP